MEWQVSVQAELRRASQPEWLKCVKLGENEGSPLGLSSGAGGEDFSVRAFFDLMYFERIRATY